MIHNYRVANTFDLIEQVTGTMVIVVLVIILIISCVLEVIRLFKEKFND